MSFFMIVSSFLIEYKVTITYVYYTLRTGLKDTQFQIWSRESLILLLIIFLIVFAEFETVLILRFF